MNKKIFLILLLLFNCIFIKNIHAIDINYQPHVQEYGWRDTVKNDEIAGTTGKSRRMEAIKINISGTEISGNIEYQAHVQDKGWMNYVKNGEVSGTTGKSLRMEAIKIKLTGDLSNYYDVYYKAHVQDIGWMDYVKNGEISGTTGKSLRMEAIQIKLVEKEKNNDKSIDENISSMNENSYSQNELISYTTADNNNKYQNYVYNGEMSGTTGKAIPLKGIKIKLNSTINGNVEYQTYYNEKLSNVSKNDEISGNGTSSLEAIKIKLTGDVSNNYDIYYRVHVSNIGWMDYVKNDTLTGTKNCFYAIEAIEIKLLIKNDSSIKIGNNYYKESKNDISYSSHVSTIGWQNYVNNGEIAGTTGKRLQMEAIKIKTNSIIGNIEYNVNSYKKGFLGYKSSDDIGGTTGNSLKMEAIQIRLTGSLANHFDIYYRTHVSDIGWLGWAKNDEKSGSVGNGNQVEAIQIKLLPKGSSAPGSTNNKYYSGTFSGSNYYTSNGTKVTGWQWIDGIRYYFNSKGNMMGKNVKKVIDVSSWQQNIDWDKIKLTGDIDEAILRVGWGMSYSDEAGIDSTFDYNIKAVQRLNIPYSVYIFAYAKVPTAGEKEANFMHNMMQKYNIPKSTYVWYDAEMKYPKETYNSVVPAFINRMHSLGYNNVGLYGSLWNLEVTNLSDLRNYPIWVAQYNITNDYSYPYKGWQYSSTESVDGINGNVDINMFY